MEKLQAELIHIKCELQNEKQIRNELETKFLEEKKLLRSNFDDIKRKNDELSKIVQKKNDDQQTNCEFLLEMQEKYKKREEELLDSLKEARDQLKSFSNNTDDETNQIICTDESSVSVDIKVYLEECKNQLSLLKSKLEFEQPIPVIQKMFNEIKKLNEEMLVNCTDCSNDLQDFLNVLKYMFDLSSIMFSDDTIILDLENEKRQLQHREKTYELQVSKQDEEIKHLSENVLQYINELAFHKNEVTKYKNLAKSESSLQTDLDFSIMTTDAKNTTDYDINNDTIFNQSEQILKSDQYVQTEEDIFGLVQSKDKEIEDLSDKIMEYIDQLSAQEQELNQLKSLLNSDQLTIDDKLIKEKDDKIKELRTTVHKYNEKINKYISELQSQKDSIKEKDTEIEDLSDNIMNYLSEINDLNVQLQSEKNLLNTKNEEINNLSNQINIYNSQLSSAKEKIKILELASTTQDEAKEIQIIDLTEKVTSYSEQLKEILEEFDKYKSDVQAKQSLVDMKNKEIEELKIKLSNMKEELHLVQTEININLIELNETKDKLKELTAQRINTSADNDLIQVTNEITELTEKVKFSSEKLSVQENYAAIIEARNLEIREKDKGIKDLSSKLNEYVIKLIAAENELQTYKSNMEREISMQENNHKEKQELETRLSVVEEELQKYKLVIQKEKDSFQIIELSETMFAVQNELEKYKNIITTKDKEIQEVLWKLTAAENEIWNCKSNADIDKDTIESKNTEIKEMKTNIINYINQLATADAILKEYESDLKIQKDLTEAKTKEFDKLSDNIFDYVHKLSTTETNLEKCKNDLKNLKELLNHKDREIKELSSQIINCTDQLSTIKLQLYKSSEETQSKDKEVQELTSKIVYYEEQLISTEEKIKNYKSNIEEQIKLLDSKSTEIVDLERKAIIFEDLINELEKLTEIKSLEIQELNLKLLCCNKQVQEYQEEIGNINSEKTNSEHLKVKQDLEHANKTISELRNDLSQISIIEELLSKSKLDVEKAQRLVQLKETEIVDLSEKINLYRNLVSSKDEEFIKYKTQLEEDQNIIRLKDQAIMNVTGKIVKYENEIFEKDKIVNDYKRDLESEKDNTEKRIQNIREEYSNQTAKFQEEINHLKFSLNEKIEIIVYRENDIKSLNDKIYQYTKKMQQLNLHNETLLKDSSKYEILKKKFNAEEIKSIEYVNIIRTLEQQITSLNYQAKQMKQQHEVVQTSNLQYSTMIENLQTQICALQEHITQQECTLKQVESEKNKMIKCNSLLRSTSLTEIQKTTDKLREQSKHVANLQMEIVTLQSMHDSKTKLTEEIAELKKKNEDYNKKLQQVTDKASSKISSYNNIVLKLKQDQELLKMQLTAEKETYRTTYDQLVDSKTKLTEEIAELKKKNEDYNKKLQQVTDKASSKISSYNNIVLKLKQDQELLKMQLTAEKETYRTTYDQLVDSKTKLTEEIAELKKKNEDYNKKLQQVTDKASSKISSYNNMILKLKQDQELLKMQLTAEKETYRTTYDQLVELQNEMKKIKSGLSDSDVVKLQTKIKNLEETNRQLIQSIVNHQEQIHMKSNEYSAMKETTDQLKYENLDLHKKTKNLNDKLCETEVLLKSAKINVQLLEKEKQNYNESYRNLQESLKNVKYELNELKTKERENLPSFMSNKSNDKSSECTKCKQRMPLGDIEIDHDKISQLQNENEELRKRCDQIQNLCKLREDKINDLERQVQSNSNQ